MNFENKLFIKGSFTGITSNIMSLDVLDNGYLASASYNGEVFLWDTNRYELYQKNSTQNPILSMVALPDNFIAFSSNFVISIWDFNINKFYPNKTLNGHTGLVNHLILMDNYNLVSASADKTIRSWNISSGVYENILIGHSEAVQCLVKLPKNILASGSDDMIIKIWDMNRNGTLITNLIGHTGSIRALACLEKGFLASSAWDHLIFIWDLNVFKVFKILESTATVYTLDVLKSGELVSGLSNGYIQIWNKTDFGLIKSVFIDNEEIRCFGLLHNGYLAMGLANSVLNILKIHY